MNAARSTVAAFAFIATVAGNDALADTPPVLAPAAPFPSILASSFERTTVAPGVVRTTYRLRTAAGPLVVSVVTVNPSDARVHVATVLARDTIASADERVSSMARRTHAIAGINGDYFDISGSGAPLGILVRDGVLLRSPSTRPALTIDAAGSVRFDRFVLTGTIASPSAVSPLSAVNVWPARGAVALFTSDFAPASTPAGITLLGLVPAGAGNDGIHYRVSDSADTPASAVRIAVGAGGPAVAQIGDDVVVSVTTAPSLAGIRSAIGGGPMLVNGGVSVDDPASPNYATRARRIPASAAARLADGSLALVVVDGHRAVTSIGVSRAEFCALLIALGATDAMLLDSGGSATLVARNPGDVDAGVVNDPSDGVERPVADGLFVYSDLPVGPPAQLVLTPSRIVALPGARVALRARVVDVAGHVLRDATGPWTQSGFSGAAIGTDGILRVGARGASGDLVVSRDGVQTTLPVDIESHAARLVIGPAQANPNPHTPVALTADVFDARDRPLASDGVVRWSAANGVIDDRGRLIVGDRNATIAAEAGGVRSVMTVAVGRHVAALGLVDLKHPWTLVTVPANAAGAVQADERGLTLAYDFRAGERAAYAIGDVPLGTPLALSCAFDGDGNGEAVRATLVDRYGDRDVVTFVRALTFTDTRRLTITVGASLAPPIVLHAIYAVGTLATPPIAVAGSLTVHDCTTTVAGT